MSSETSKLIQSNFKYTGKYDDDIQVFMGYPTDVNTNKKASSNDQKVSFSLMMVVLVSMISQFLVGYNTAVMNAPEAVVFPDHSTTQWSLAVSSYAIGGPGGAILGGYLANIKGRKGALILNSWIFIIGGIMMTFAPNVNWLIPSRFIIGFASGLSSVVVPIYLGEVAPLHLRGTLGTCTQFALVIGIFVSSFLAFPLATKSSWRYLFAFTPLLALLQLIISPFVVESYRWLLSRNPPNGEEARNIIQKLSSTYKTDDEISIEINSIVLASNLHQRSSNNSGCMSNDISHYRSVSSLDDQNESKPQNASIIELLHSKEYRKLVITSVGLQLAQQLCGINAVFYYSTSFFNGIIDNPLQGTCLVNFINVVATYVALKLMDSSYRRHLLLISSGGMGLSCLLLTYAALGYTYKSIALLAVMLFVTFFEIGLGPIPWLIVAEYFDSRYIATAMSLSCIVNWICNFVVGISFPYLQQLLGVYVFLPFGMVLLIIFLFTLFYVTESYGRSVEEIYCMVNKIQSIDE